MRHMYSALKTLHMTWHMPSGMRHHACNLATKYAVDNYRHGHMQEHKTTQDGSCREVALEEARAAR